MKKARLVVMISGNGGNLEAILQACSVGQLAAEVVHVVSNNNRAYGLVRAARYGVPTSVHRREGERQAYDARLANFVTGLRPDWIVLAGWMHILSMNFLSRFSDRVINLHPALPGQFAGTHAIERAFEAYQQGQILHTGIMVHLVPDEGVDDGPVLASEVVPILPEDTLESLRIRIAAAEHRVLVDTIGRLITGELVELPTK